MFVWLLLLAAGGLWWMSVSPTDVFSPAAKGEGDPKEKEGKAKDPLDFDEPTNPDAVAAAEVEAEGGDKEGKAPEQSGEEEGGGDDKGDAEDDSRTADDKVEPDEKSGFDDELLSIAADYGLSREEALNYATPEALEDALIFRAQAAQAGEGGKEEEEEDVGEEEEEEGLVGGLDEEIVAPEIVQAFQEMNDHFTRQVKDLQRTVDALQSSAQLRQQQAFEERFDERIEKLGKDYSPLFGKGRAVNMDRNSDEYRNRAKVLDEMAAIAIGYSQIKRAVPSESALFKRAVAAVFDETSESVARNKIAGQLRDRKGQFVPRPTQRAGGTSASPTQAAISAVHRKMREHGMLDEQLASAEEDAGV